jgi:hypothetical protein
VDIETNLSAFIGDRMPDARYTSFDYCFNYFQSFWEQGRTAELADPDNMQLSCLHLGFYLASWGMFRGSSTLLLKSPRHYEPVVKVVGAEPASIWEIDAHCYSDATWSAIKRIDQQIRSAFSHPGGVSDILVTKVMLGVFGNVPAFDTFFRAGSAPRHSDRKPSADSPASTVTMLRSSNATGFPPSTSRPGNQRNGATAAPKSST